MESRASGIIRLITFGAWRQLSQTLQKYCGLAVWVWPFLSWHEQQKQERYKIHQWNKREENCPSRPANVIHYRIFLHHAVNACLVRTIPDSKILAGQDTPSGSDMVKVQQALDDTLAPTPLTKELCEELSRTLHAIHPPSEDSGGMAVHLMEAADMWFEHAVREDARLNKWWDDLRANGATSSRFQVKVKKKKGNAKLQP